VFRDFSDRYRVTILSLAALVLPVFLLYIHGRSPRETTFVEKGLMQITSPVQSAAAQMFSGVEDAWKGYVALRDVELENVHLKEELSVLTVEALRAKRLAQENVRLRKLLKFQRNRAPLETLAAHVIGQDVSPYSRVIRIAIDVGQGHGVTEGSPVLAAEGLVGRVKSVSEGFAEVMLSVDLRSSVNVRVVGKDVTGHLQGTGAIDSYNARFLFLHKGRPIEVGDTLTTTGFDKVFPAGIEVGYVRSLEERQSGLYFELQVAPAVSFSTLSEVLVVTHFGPREEPTEPGHSAQGSNEGKESSLSGGTP
jgi:rod shape-determining protein MreC